MTGGNMLGITEQQTVEAGDYSDLYIGRVVSQSRDLYKVKSDSRELFAEISGKLRYSAVDAGYLPVVGDFVLLDRDSNKHGAAIIHIILKRKSFVERRAAGSEEGNQPLAANIDTIFICMGLNGDYNLRRLERYLSITWASGAMPVVVLTKADLCPDLVEKLTEVKLAAPGADVVITSALAEDGWQAILPYIKPGLTVAFLGSSGVGKSTLINRLLVDDQIRTGETRKFGKGRHTTTKRELIFLPSGAIVMDTPGMRELGLESADLGRTFSDIEELAKRCRFSDCKHVSEPGCAVKDAIKEGLLDQSRLDNYLKLQKEARYEGLNAKEIEKEKINSMFSGFGGMKNAREYVKNKYKGPRMK